MARARRTPASRSRRTPPRRGAAAAGPAGNQYQGRHRRAGNRPADLNKAIEEALQAAKDEGQNPDGKWWHLDWIRVTGDPINEYRIQISDM